MSDDKKNKIKWVSEYVVTDMCCGHMTSAIKAGKIAARSSHPGTAGTEGLAIAAGSSWYKFNLCPWCGYNLE